MAFYNSTKAVRPTDLPEQYQLNRPVGSKPAGPGIYECQNCGFEDVINRECSKLPPCSNCREKSHDWKMIVKPSFRTCLKHYQSLDSDRLL